MSGDDAYQKFQCGGDFWSQYHINVLYVDSGNLLLGVARCLAFMMFLCFQWYNKVLLDRKHANNVNVIKGLILPSYLPFIYFYMLFSMCTGLIDLINQATYKSEEFDSWVYPIEIGITHWFLEGLAIFLMRYGAGVQAIRRSLRMSFMWGIFTTFWFIIIFSILNNRFNTDRDHDEDKLYSMFIAYEIVVFCFYGAYAVVPSKYLYHRPALRFYARFSAISTGIVICFASLYHCGVYTIICPGSIVAFIFAAFLQPLAIFKTLQIDSQYWQGLSPEQGNPLTEVWDHLGIETASSMAENLEQFGRINRKLPILHFGLMNFDTDLKFVAGGFSRVYFGTLRGERVAFKILFAMELDPKDVEEFYREAAVLHTLKHTNVVKCLGVCVMPPALAIVLELCKYGSLFDFLYKPVTAAPPKNRHSISSLIRSSLIGTRNSLIGAPPQQDLDFSHNGGPGPHLNTGNMSAGLELRNMEPEPSFSAPTGKATEEGWRTLSISTMGSASECEVKNPISTGTSNRPFTSFSGPNGGLPSGVSPLVLASATPSMIASHASEVYNHAAGIRPSGSVRPSGAGPVSMVAGLESPNGSLDEDEDTPTPVIPVRGMGQPIDISGTGTSGGSGSGGGGPATLQKQRSGRTLAAIMQAPFRANDAGRDARSNSNSPNPGNGADYTPRQSGSGRSAMGANLSFNKRLVMMRDAIAGIAFLHEKGYMHCDIKSLNFLVAEDYVLKLADMGEARLISAPPKRNVPPIPARNWAPPEVLVDGASADSYTVASDVYGLCIVLAEIILAELPFGDTPNLISVQKWHSMLAVDNLRPTLPTALPGPLRKIIEQGWSTTPSERPTAQEILKVIDEYVILDRPHSFGDTDEV